MISTHIDVLPFTAATEAAVASPYQLTEVLERLDDKTLAAVRAVGDYMARAAAAVQGHRRFDEMWRGIESAAEVDGDAVDDLVALLAELPVTEPVDPAGRHAADTPDTLDDPPAEPVAEPVVDPAVVVADLGVVDQPDRSDESDRDLVAEADTTVVLPSELVEACMTPSGPWPDSTESESESA